MFLRFKHQSSTRNAKHADWSETGHQSGCTTILPEFCCEEGKTKFASIKNILPKSGYYIIILCICNKGSPREMNFRLTHTFSVTTSLLRVSLPHTTIRRRLYTSRSYILLSTILSCAPKQVSGGGLHSKWPLRSSKCLRLWGMSISLTAPSLYH